MANLILVISMLSEKKWRFQSRRNLLLLQGTSGNVRTPATKPDRDDLEFSDAGDTSKKTKDVGVIEIIDEDPKMALRPKSIKMATSPTPAAGEQVTDADKKIINVDQISDISGLILPKGVSFKIDELNFTAASVRLKGQGHFRRILMRSGRKISLLLVLRTLILMRISELKRKNQRSNKKDSDFAHFSKRFIPRLRNMTPKNMVRLWILPFKPQPGVEEVEIYPVNPPYAYIQIIYDHTTHEYTYLV